MHHRLLSDESSFNAEPRHWFTVGLNRHFAATR
jgi:hypothetical protein